jgi:hypothetical protein
MDRALRLLPELESSPFSPRKRDWKQGKPKHTTYGGGAIRRTTRGSALLAVFGVPGLSSQRLCLPVAFPPGMRMAPRETLKS